MPDAQIRLSALWAALMFTYLLGDELRLTTGDVTPGELGGLSQQVLPAVWLGVAVLMLIPIVMVVVSVTLTGQTLRRISVIAAAFNAATARYAWTSCR